MLPLSELIGKSLNVHYEIDWYGSADSRSYKVTFKKFQETVSNDFRPLYTLRDGILEMYTGLKSGKLKESIETKTVEWYKYLIDSYELISEVTIRNTLL
jgi:hypothetical protein